MRHPDIGAGAVRGGHVVRLKQRLIFDPNAVDAEADSCNIDKLRGAETRRSQRPIADQRSVMPARVRPVTCEQHILQAARVAGHELDDVRSRPR